MAKKRRKNPDVKRDVTEKAAPSVPKFEIGIKGDEFDVKYTRAAAAKTSDADSLLRGLSKETRVSGFNLLNFSFLTLIILVLSLSFALLSREEGAPKLTLNSLFKGGYTADLTEYYKNTLPLGRAFRTVGAYLGFGDMPTPLPDEPQTDGDNQPEPVITTAATEPTVPATTTPPTTTEVPASAPVTTTVTEAPPETFTMYTKKTLNIRLLPDDDSMIMGYFARNEAVEVIEIRDDGWASIWYNGIVAYVSADYLSEGLYYGGWTPPASTESVPEETEAVPDETEAQTSVTDDMTEPFETEPSEETLPATTTAQRFPEFWIPSAPTTVPSATEPPETLPPEAQSSETQPSETESEMQSDLPTAPSESDITEPEQ